MSLPLSPVFVPTCVGNIAVYHRKSSSAQTPIIFLHGVYFDHQLWDNIIAEITDRTVYVLDMPLHGKSRNLTVPAWTLSDVANMLLDVLAHFSLQRVIAVGHSWGSMTILRSASLRPERFEQLVLCNMPFLPASRKQKIQFVFQHLLIPFRNFYTGQAAKALFGKTSLQQNPSLLQELKRPMDVLSNRDIRVIDKTVILDADDASNIIRNLKVNAIAIIGEEDYVPTLPGLETQRVAGGHISPLEAAQEIIGHINNY